MSGLDNLSDKQLEQELKRRSALKYAAILAKRSGVPADDILASKDSASEAERLSRLAVRREKDELEEKYRPYRNRVDDLVVELEDIKEAREAMNAWQQNQWEYR